jgi:hypothetical protein
MLGELEDLLEYGRRMAGTYDGLAKLRVVSSNESLRFFFYLLNTWTVVQQPRASRVLYVSFSTSLLEDAICLLLIEASPSRPPENHETGNDPTARPEFWCDAFGPIFVIGEPHC